MTNAVLQGLCTLFLENREVLEANFRWENDLMNLAGSLIYTGDGLRVNPALLKECEAILNAGSSAFSDFRGNLKMPLLCRMARSGSPERSFREVEAIYRKLVKSKWLGSDEKLLAAMILQDHGSVETADGYIERLNTIYAGMKQRHRWITSEEDIPFAAMLAVTDGDIDAIMEETELCFDRLKKKFGDPNSVQSLCHVLALDHVPGEENCDRVIALYDRLKELRHPFGASHELAVLGALSMTECPVEQLAQELIEADEWLRQQKGCSDFAMGAEQRRLYAAVLVMNAHRPEPPEADGLMLSSMLSFAVAMEVTTMLVINTIIFN